MRDRLSQRTNKMFLIASLLTFVSVGAIMALTIVDMSFGLPSLSFGRSIPAMVGFGLCFLAAIVSVVTQFALWLGMIWITLADNQPLLFKVPLVLFQLVFMSIGSAIVYLAFYRSGSKHLAGMKVT